MLDFRLGISRTTESGTPLALAVSSRTLQLERHTRLRIVVRGIIVSCWPTPMRSSERRPDPATGLCPVGVITQIQIGRSLEPQ